MSIACACECVCVCVCECIYSGVHACALVDIQVAAVSSGSGKECKTGSSQLYVIFTVNMCT